ncbi:major outer membrane protein [Malaciobacter mytili]|uniref:major outer membrane protein n=1 Tax=Malaciobacter mytili TaxID=603050 RepID=UPI003BB03254
MKKFAKMSLVAAVAVAGLSTTSSAKALEEAIKNVDVSGTVVYRYDDRSYDDKDTDLANNNYKIGLTLKSKVNDDVTAVTRFIVGSQADGGFATLGTTESDNGNIAQSDAQADVSLSNVYFSYTGIANTTVNVGKQGLTTPWTVAIDADGNEQTGTGILALTNVGPVTLAGAYFNNTNLNASGGLKLNGTKYHNGTKTTAVLAGDANVITVGAMANIGPVALDAWYLDMEDTFDTYTIGALAKFDLDAVKLSIGARHTQLDIDNALDKNFAKEDNSLTKVEAGVKVGIFGANVGYGWTDSEGGLAALDNDANSGFQGWTMNLNGVADASLLKVSVDAQVLPSLNLALNYNVLEKDKNDARAKDLTDKEMYVQASYQMSKNFGGYVRLGKAELEDAFDGKDNDGTIGRLQVQYSF